MATTRESTAFGAESGASRLRNRFPSLGLPAGVRRLLASLACACLLVPLAAHGSGFFDKLKEATKAMQDINNVLHTKHSTPPADTSSNGQTQRVSRQPTHRLVAAHSAATRSESGRTVDASAGAGTAAVMQKVVGPLMANTDAYTVSLKGAHLATLNMHGSRFVVTVDGVNGPRVNAVFGSRAGYSGAKSQKHGVAMSDDGSRYAYVARVGHQIVIFAGNKELLKFPDSSIGGPLFLIFSPHTGKHLFFGAAGKYQYEEALWVDGKPAMAYDTRTKIAFSADGEHYLYIGVPEPGHGKRALVVDGTNRGYNLDGIELGADLAPRFLGDGRHVIWVTTTVDHANGNYVARVFVDGKPVVSANQVVRLVAAPQGDGYAVVVQDHDNSQWAVYLNGQEVPGTRYSSRGVGTAPVVTFSPDGKHLAVACNTGNGNAYVVRDGKKGETYDRIQTGSEPSDPSAMRFSADSQSLGYFGVAGQKAFAVVDGKEYGTAFRPYPGLYYSPEGHHVAVVGQVADALGSVVYVDGKRALTGTNVLNPKTFKFNRDGSHWLIIDIGNRHEGFYFDGRSLPFVYVQNLRHGDYQFSPDGSELVVRGQLAHHGFGLYLYNVSMNRFARVGPSRGVRWISDPIFSPDGKHLYYQGGDGKVFRAMGSTFRRDFIYVDGHRTNARIQAGFFPKFQWPEQRAACWAVGADDKLYALRSANNAVTRFVVTPPAGGLAALWGH